MKINKFIKKKNGMYLLELESNTQLKIHEDLILKYNLLLNKTLDSLLIDKIQKENEFYEIYEVALKYLNIRIRSKKEMIKYLLNKGYTEDNVINVIEKLESQGYLNDRVYAISFVHDKLLTSSYGPKRISLELAKNSIQNEIITEAMLDYTEEIEKERIKKILEKQIKHNTNKGPSLLKRKIQSYLLNLGYNIDYINKELNSKNLMDDSIIEREYQKLYQKLSKKYSGKELEYRLKQKMYQKGFTISEYD